MTAGLWVQEELKRAGLPYRTVTHPAVATAQELAQAEHFSGRRVAKVVVIVADGRRVFLVLPANRRLAWAGLKEKLGAKTARLAREDEMAHWFPDCEVGAEPPLRHWADLDIWMDESLRTDQDILFAGGTHLDGIEMNFNDWFKLVRPQAGSFSAPPGATEENRA